MRAGPIRWGDLNSLERRQVWEYEHTCLWSNYLINESTETDMIIVWIGHSLWVADGACWRQSAEVSLKEARERNRQTEWKERRIADSQGDWTAAVESSCSRDPCEACSYGSRWEWSARKNDPDTRLQTVCAGGGRTSQTPRQPETPTCDATQPDERHNTMIWVWHRLAEHDMVWCYREGIWNGREGTWNGWYASDVHDMEWYGVTPYHSDRAWHPKYAWYVPEMPSQWGYRYRGDTLWCTWYERDLLWCNMK